MAINSHAELRRLLDQIQSLDASDVADIVGSAHYNANGRLDGMYSGPLVAKASPSEIAGFLGAAGAHHPDYGGAIKGDVVRQNAYPTDNATDPCVDRNDWWCWEG